MKVVDGLVRLSLGPPDPLEPHRRVALLAWRARRVTGHQLVEGLVDDEVPELVSNLVRHLVGLVTDEKLDGTDFVALAGSPVAAGDRERVLTDEVPHVNGQVALVFNRFSCSQLANDAFKVHVYARGKRFSINYK